MSEVFIFGMPIECYTGPLVLDEANNDAQQE